MGVPGPVVGEGCVWGRAVFCMDDGFSAWGRGVSVLLASLFSAMAHTAFVRPGKKIP